MRVQFLANVGDDAKGTILDIEDRRAERLIRTGYAKAAPLPKKAGKD
jgi:hypothetical protein